MAGTAAGGHPELDVARVQPGAPTRSPNTLAARSASGDATDAPRRLTFCECLPPWRRQFRPLLDPVPHRPPALRGGGGLRTLYWRDRNLKVPPPRILLNPAPKKTCSTPRRLHGHPIFWGEEVFGTPGEKALPGASAPSRGGAQPERERGVEEKPAPSASPAGRPRAQRACPRPVRRAVAPAGRPIPQNLGRSRSAPTPRTAPPRLRPAMRRAMRRAHSRSHRRDHHVQPAGGGGGEQELGVRQGRRCRHDACHVYAPTGGVGGVQAEFLTNPASRSASASSVGVSELRARAKAYARAKIEEEGVLRE